MFQSVLTQSVLAMVIQTGAASEQGLVGNFQFDSHDHHLLHSVPSGNYSTDLTLSVSANNTFSTGSKLVCLRPFRPSHIASLKVQGTPESFLNASSVLDGYTGADAGKSMSIGMWTKLSRPSGKEKHPINQQGLYTLIHLNCRLIEDSVCPHIIGSEQFNANLLEVALTFDNATGSYKPDKLVWAGNNMDVGTETPTAAVIPTGTWLYILFTRSEGVSKLYFLTHDELYDALDESREPQLHLLRSWKTTGRVPGSSTSTSVQTEFLTKDGLKSNVHKLNLFGYDRFNHECGDDGFSFRQRSIPAQITSLRFYTRSINTTEIVDIAQEDWCPTVTETPTIPLPLERGDKDTSSTSIIIGVVAAVVGCLICIGLGVLAWFCWRKHQQKNEEPEVKDVAAEQLLTTEPQPGEASVHTTQFVPEVTAGVTPQKYPNADDINMDAL